MIPFKGLQANPIIQQIGFDLMEEPKRNNLGIYILVVLLILFLFSITIITKKRKFRLNRK